MAERSFDYEYLPATWTADGLADTLESTAGSPPIPRYDDADAWAAIREDVACQPVLDAIVDEAERVLEVNVPPRPASLYLEYLRGDGVSEHTVMEPMLARTRQLSLVATVPPSL